MKGMRTRYHGRRTGPQNHTHRYKPRINFQLLRKASYITSKGPKPLYSTCLMMSAVTARLEKYIQTPMLQLQVRGAAHGPLSSKNISKLQGMAGVMAGGSHPGPRTPHLSTKITPHQNIPNPLLLPLMEDRLPATLTYNMQAKDPLLNASTTPESIIIPPKQ